MPSGTIDSLEIEISASSDAAVKKLESLADTLKQLKSVLGGDTAAKINDLSESMKTLRDSMAKVRISKTLTDGLSAFGASLKSIDLSRLQGFSRIMQGLSGLQNVKMSTSLTKGLREVADLVENISEAAVNRLDRMTAALQRLAGVNLTGLRNAAKMVSEDGSAAMAIRNAGMTAGGRSGGGGRVPPTGRIGGGIGGNQEPGGEPINFNFPRLAGESIKAASGMDKVNRAFQILSTVERAAGRALNAFIRNAIIPLGKASLNASWQVTKLVGKEIGNQFQRMTQPVRNFAKSVTSVVSAFKRIAFYRFIRTVIKEIGEAFSTGVNNLYQWSKALGEAFSTNMDSAATSMLYFKNSIGAAVAPILNALIPALNALIDKIVEAINWINQLFAKLSGASSWYKAKRVATEYADSAKKAGAAAKEALKYLAPFDELNVLPDDKSGGGGGGASDLDYSEMFDKVGLDEKFAWIDEVKAKLAQLFEPFKKAWENEGQNTIDSIKRAFNAVVELAASIGRSFEEVWLNGTGQQTLETWLRIIQNISGIVENLANNFRIAWDEGGRGTQIVQNLWDAWNTVLSIIEEITSSTKEWAENLDFGPLLDSVGTLTGAFGSFAAMIKGPITFVWEKIVLPLGKFVVEKLIPNVITLTGKLIDLGAAIGEKVNPILQAFYLKFIQPIAQYLETKFTLAIQYVIDVIDLLTHAIRDDVEEGNELYDKVKLLQRVFEDFWGPIDDVVQIFKDLVSISDDLHHLFDNDLEPSVKKTYDGFGLLKGIIEVSLMPIEMLGKALDAVRTILDAIAGAAKDARGSLSDFANNIPVIGTIKSNIETIKNDAKEAWSTITGKTPAKKTAVKAYAAGGFPEDGLFWANHNELVGRFSNGKTAVANNDQIVAGISAGVEDANESVVTAIYSAATQMVNAIRESGGGSDVDWNYVAQRVSRAQRSNARAMGTA